MKKILVLSSLACALIFPVIVSAAPLVSGSQISRSWSLVNGQGLSMLNSTTGPFAGFKVRTSDNESIWQISTQGAHGFGTGSNAFGRFGQCIKSFGGSGSSNYWDDCTATGAVVLIGDQRYVKKQGDTMTGDLINTKNITARELFGTGSALTLLRLGASTYSTVQDLMNFATSPGVTSGGIITVSGTTYTVGAGNGFIKATDSNVAQLRFMKWSGSSAIIASNSTLYLGVDYNSGAPKVISKATDTFDLDTQFPLGVVVNDAGTLYKMNNDWRVGDTVANIIERFDSDALIERDEREGGLILGNTGTRNITISAGQLLARLSEFPIVAIDTSASSTFDTYYRDGGGGWTKGTGATQWDNANYDDGDGGLAAVTALQYASKWFYLMSDGTVAMLYGRTVSTAIGTIIEEDTPPSTVPDRVGKTGLLIGRIVFQGSSNTPVEIQSAFDSEFNATAVSDHGELAGLSDDDHTQYLLASGLRALTGNWEAGAFTIDSATLSGGLVYGRRTLASSGTLVFEGAATGSSLYVASQFNGVGLSTCTGGNKLLWSGGRFSCAADIDTNTTYTAGQGLGLNGTIFTLNSTISGSLVRFNTLSGSLVYGKNTLASSGSIVWEGAGSGSSLYVATTVKTGRTLTSSGNLVVEGAMSGASLFLGTSLKGAGLTDCDTAYNRLQWDSITGRFGCDQTHAAKMTRGAAQSINNLGFQKIYFDTVEYDTAAIANTTPGATGSGRITITKAGLYLVAGYLYLNVGSNTHLNAVIYVNGSAIARTRDSLGTIADSAVAVSDTFLFGVGDYIELYARQNGAGSANTSAQVDLQPRLSVVEIGH